MSSSSPLMELLRRGKKTEAKNPQPPSEKLSSSSSLMELLKHEKQPEAKKSQPPSENMSSSSPLMELLRRGKKTEAKNPQPPSEKLSSSSLMELLKHEKQPEVKKSQPPSEKMSSPLMELLRRGKIIEVKNPQPPSEKMSSSPLMELLKHENQLEEMNYQAPSEHGKQSEVKVDYFTLGEGVHSGSFKVSTDSSGSKETIAADFGGSAIGRVSPLNSGFWWIILLRAYTEFNGDHTLRERSEVKKEMRLILKLCLSDDFDTSPTLLCADGCSMIDSRMGICGYPVEIRALFCFALRCAMQLLKPEDTDKDSRDSSRSKETIAADFGGSASVPDMAHAGKERLSSGNKRKGGDDEPDRANKRPIARLGRPRPPIEVYRLDHGGRITEVAPTLYSVENRYHIHLVGSIGSVGHMLSISSIESALRQCLISADIDPSRHIEHLYYSRRTDCWGEVQSLPTPSEDPSQYADRMQQAADWTQFKSSVMGVLVSKGDLQI